MPNSKYSSLLKNSLWGSGSFIFITLISFLILPFIINKLSIEGYGIYILITSLVGFYGILDLGLGSALIKYVAELYEKNDHKNLNNYINSSVIFQGLIGLLSSIAIMFFSKNIINLLNISQGNDQEATYSLNLCAIGFFFTFIGGAYKAVLQGLQLYKVSSLMDSIINLALNIFVAIVLYMGYGLIGSILINVLVAFISFLGYYVLVKKNLPTYAISIALNVKILKDIVSFSFFIFLSKISNMFSNYIVRFVISFFLGPEAVTYYTVPSKLVGAIGGIASSSISAIFPFSSQLSAANNDAEIKTLFLKSSRIFIAIIFPISFFICIFSRQILTLWMGAEFAKNSWLVLTIICFSSFIGGLSAIPNLIILGRGNSKLIGLFSIFTIILYIISLPLLTKFFGIIGTAIALLITSCGVIYYVIIKTTEYTNININEFLNFVLRPHLNFFILGALLLPVVVINGNQKPIVIFTFGIILMLLHYLFLMRKELIPIKNIYHKLFQNI